MTILKSFAISFFATPVMLSGANKPADKNTSPRVTNPSVTEQLEVCVPCHKLGTEQGNKQTAKNEVSDNKLLYR